MPRYWYCSEEAPTERRYVEAAGLAEAVLAARARGIAVCGAGEAASRALRLPRVKDNLLTSVYEQVAALLDQGVELSDGLQRLAAEAISPALARTLLFLAERVAEGVALSEAMAEQPATFAEVALAAVAAGEASGDLAGALRSLTQHQREVQHLVADLALPFLYPVFLLAALSLMLIVVPTFLLDKFVYMYRELGLTDEQLPLVTRFIITLVPLLRLVGVPALVAVAALAVVWQVRRKLLAGRLEVRPLGLPIRLFGRLAMCAALARVAATLGLLLRAGVPAERAVRLAGRGSGNRHVDLALRRAGQHLAEGGRLSEGLRESGLLPESFSYALGAAEASGTLVETLGELETEYRRALETESRQWVVLMGPSFVLALGVVVAVVGLSLYLPLVTLIGELSQ